MIYNRIDERQYLIPLSRRVPFFYIEKSMLVKKHELFCRAYRVAGKIVYESIPIATISAIVCGPGTSITNEAMRLASLRGCIVFFSGGYGVPVFAKSSFARSSKNKINQYQ